MLSEFWNFRNRRWAYIDRFIKSFSAGLILPILQLIFCCNFACYLAGYIKPLLIEIRIFQQTTPCSHLKCHYYHVSGRLAFSLSFKTSGLPFLQPQYHGRYEICTCNHSSLKFAYAYSYARRTKRRITWQTFPVPRMRPA